VAALQELGIQPNQSRIVHGAEGRSLEHDVKRGCCGMLSGSAGCCVWENMLGEKAEDDRLVLW
jgi:hypothetical protein